MKVRAGFLLSSATGALLIGAGAMSGALAADPVAGVWSSEGFAELGGRFFLNNPSRNGVISGASGKENSLAKFYEYRDLRPGLLGNLGFKAGTKNGLHGIDFWANNIGYDDQNYSLGLSKAGEHYLNLGWEQTPHLYSTSARTLYNGVGTNSLTIPDAVRQQLYAAGSNDKVFSGYINPTNVQSIINANVHQTDIGIRRDTASVDYRWTPNSNWDIKADYAHMHRTGTQVQGVVFGNSSSNIVSEVPKPVNDTTQNFGLNGEYAGTSLWGQKFNIKLAYVGSIYRGDDFYDIANPFRDDAHPSTNVTTGTGAGVGVASAGTAASSMPLTARMSLWPDNSAHGLTGTLGAELPGKSRYMGTYSYTMMRQNEAFLPYTVNPYLQIGGLPANSASTLPYANLDGKITTFLTNNVVTTQITRDLKSKLSYRYFDFSNGTADKLFPSVVGTDLCVTGAGCTTATGRTSIASSYNKQNAGAELTWRPFRSLTTGIAYGWERYNWALNDADSTTENFGKIYATHTVTDRMRARASWQYSERRYGIYTNAVRNMAGTWNPNYRNPELANRDQNKAKLQIDFDVSKEIMLSPFGGLQLKQYRTDAYGARELGILDDQSWNAGLELGFTPVAGTQFFFSFTHEDYKKRLVGGGGTSGFGTNAWDSTLKDKVDTFTAAWNQALIPNKLDLKVSYTYSIAQGSWTTVPFVYSGYVDSGTLVAPHPIYPDTENKFHRLDVNTIYKVDESVIRQMGWKGEIVVKTRYAWERNSMTNFQNDVMQPYMYFGSFATANATSATSNGGTQQIWLAGTNPNYNVHLMAMAVTLKW